MTETEQKLKQAAKLAGRGKISRRDFIQLALASGLTAGRRRTPCSPRPPAPSPRRAAPSRSASAMAPPPTRWTPASIPTSSPARRCWGTLSNSLTEIDAKGNVIGDLAESFEPSDGAKKWVFKLQQGRRPSTMARR